MILVVASHPDTRDTFVKLISDRGYKVDAIDCGDQVLTRMSFQRPSLVILDCDLHDSFDLLAKIRSEPRIASVPVVMFSESGGCSQERAMEKGADAFVAKGSLDWVELITEINRFVGPPPSPKQ
jgi:CheY-like chemotaxis protein